MDRRTYLRTCGIAISTAALAGCTGQNSRSTSSEEDDTFDSYDDGDDSYDEPSYEPDFDSPSTPPPRKSQVVEEVEITDGAFLIELEPEQKQWVVTRRDVEVSRDPNTGTDSAASTSYQYLSATSTAGPGKGSGRGVGGYDDAPRSPTNGRAWYLGYDDADEWYEDNDDETSRLPVEIATLGIVYLGSNEAFRESPPGPGRPDQVWDETYDDPDQTVEADIATREPGWYRVGAELVVEDAENGPVDLRWEAVDLRVEEEDGEKQITERWKVSPRI
jgi:hypothetical protein